MSTLKVNKLRDTAGSADAITLDPNGGAVLAGVTTVTSVKVGTGITISESGIDAGVGVGITVRNINESHIGGRRRININGDMMVAQRGTSASVSDGSNEGYSTLDRWYLLYSSSAGGAITFSQDTDVPTDYTWGRFNHSAKLDVTTADTSISDAHAVTLQYRIEAKDIRNSGWNYTSSNSTLSISFWAKSVKAGTYCVFLFTVDGTQRNNVQEYTLEANTWKHVELEFPGDSTITFDDNYDNGMTVGWTLQAGADRYESVVNGQWISRSDGNGEGRYATSNQVNFLDSTDNNFYLTGVQIEVGKATRFEHRSYGEELQLCSRYFQQFEGGSNSLFATGFTATNDFYGGGTLPMGKMRAAPTIAVDGTLSHLNYTHVAVARDASAITNQGSGDTSFVVRLQSTSTTTDNAGAYARITNSSTNLTFDAEI